MRRASLANVRWTWRLRRGSSMCPLIKTHYRIGVVRFNDVAGDPADVLLHMEVAGGPGDGMGRDNANNNLTTANLNPSGNTSIGAGILLGSDVLDSAVADSRALIVLTDGRQNTDPDIPDATATVSTKVPKQRVFAVGLGLNQLEDKLVQIASVTNGVAQITGDLVGYKEFLLQKLYVQILSDVSDEAFVKDPLGIVLPGQKRAQSIYLAKLMWRRISSSSSGARSSIRSTYGSGLKRRTAQSSHRLMQVPCPTSISWEGSLTCSSAGCFRPSLTGPKRISDAGRCGSKTSLGVRRRQPRLPVRQAGPGLFTTR